MHALLSLLLVNVSVGLSNFAGAIGIGLSGINVRTRIRVGLAFGFFEALMPAIGLIVGHSVEGFFGQYGKYVGGAILILTGAYTIVQARYINVERKARMPRSVRTESLLVTALALSIDNLAVGFALAVYPVDVWLAALSFGVVSIVMSLLGLELGHRLGKRVEAWSEEIGGGVLILVGAAIAVGVLGESLPRAPGRVAAKPPGGEVLPRISDVAEIPKLEQVMLSAEGHIATVTLNRPDQRNPLSATMLRDLADAFRWCQAERDVRAVVLTGAGRVFCAGADLASFDGEMSGLDRYRSRDLFVDLFVLMSELGKPIVGRINGHALAGGLGLACSCDMLVAVDTATFGTPEINVGIWPMMIQAILSRNIPRKVLLEMEMLGDRWTAMQLQSLGVINRVVSHELLDSTVKEIAEQLAKKSPIAMRLGRDSFYRHQDMDFRAALHYLHGQFLLVSQTEDSREGIRAFFEKREPDFKGQ